MLKGPPKHDNLLKFCDWRGAKGCFKSDRSRKEFSNEYLVAKIGVETAENEPLNVRLIFKLRHFIFADPPRLSQVAGTR